MPACWAAAVGVYASFLVLTRAHERYVFPALVLMMTLWSGAAYPGVSAITRRLGNTGALATFVALLATLHAPLISTPGERRAGWRRERISEADYAIGWRVFDYAGHRVVFHAGAVQGYRGLMALVPGQDLGVAMVWNSDSSLPSGLLPTIRVKAPCCHTAERAAHHVAHHRQRRHPGVRRQLQAHQPVDRDEDHVVGQEQALCGGQQPEVLVHGVLCCINSEQLARTLCRSVDPGQRCGRNPAVRCGPMHGA